MGVNDLLTVQEVAQILNVSDETVYRMVRENQIPYSKIRRQIRFLSWEINNWLESNKSKP
jgi:DNA binding domain, excisionase family